MQTHGIGLPELIIVLVLAILLFGGGKLGPAIRDMFRGGPRPPSHPLPGNDSEILNRPRRQPTPGDFEQLLRVISRQQHRSQAQNRESNS